ncbi:VOC family protein [Kurthia huakuii]|uniref:VOC family protein n=1 Tax=Kurthia huakuii TaxID=1421019 RepID=UPI0004970870|nr:VOC family protein [Kurthia huakuii]MBM7700650.1 putative glyoxalase superfamily protein PhnB [Kurthia huakuii]
MKLDMVGLIVQDMQQALDFYQLLELKPLVGTADDAYMELANEGVRISLNRLDMMNDVLGFEPEFIGDKVELAFAADSKEEVDQLFHRIQQHGYNIVREPWEAPWGQYYALVRDADQNIISLFYNV